ncbi:hypothetical protein CHS0354_007027 [Potamilus streckersoni]|uniref:Uncharacterized protein n=1 Tax=Potamilus streckersoni TaxID=2493646 RepID=A0AAE0VJW5_9BIVA|nr:hypothetical protein CHS0354_007027 [Potamilus streckersoni]
MKSDSVKWGLSPGLGFVIFPSRPVTADNRVTTMKLRERALTGKPQKRRNARSNLKSAPPFQKRNLDSFPMPRGRQDAVRFALSHRKEVKDAQNSVTRQSLDSASLREYSRQMFNVAFANSPNPEQQDLKLSLEADRTDMLLSKCNSYTHRYSNPSVDGSILYKVNQQSLNSTQVRPYSEPAIKYNHERGKTVPPAIRDAITRSSEEFRIVPSHNTSRSTSMSSLSMCDSFVFVRKDNVKDIKTNSFETANTNCLDLSDAFVNVEDIVDDRVSHEVSGYTIPPTRLMPPDTKRVPNIYIVSLEEDSPSEAGSEVTNVEDAISEQGQKPPSDDSKPEIPPKSPGKKSIEKPKSGKSRPKSGRVKSAKGGKKGTAGGKTKKQKEEEPTPPPPEQEPETKPMEMKKPLRGPHCWVDDVSVTSEVLTNPELLDVGGTQVPLKGQESEAEVQNECAVPTNDKDVKGNLQDEARKRAETTLVNLSKIKEDIRLPDFICRTSERKSRDTAVKDWLASTNFRYGNRSVPLL